MSSSSVGSRGVMVGAVGAGEPVSLVVFAAVGLVDQFAAGEQALDGALEIGGLEALAGFGGPKPAVRFRGRVSRWEIRSAVRRPRRAAGRASC